MVKEKMDLLELLRKGGMDGDVDFLREALRVLVEGIMDAEVSARTGAEYGERSPERVTQRNGYRSRAWDTRVGTMELHIPKLREGSYFLRGCLQSLALVLNLMNEPQIVPQRPDGRTVGDPRPPTPTSQTRRPTPYSGPAGGSERHPVFASERMPLADGPARSASLADPVQVLPQLDHGWNVGTSQ